MTTYSSVGNAAAFGKWFIYRQQPKMENSGINWARRFDNGFEETDENAPFSPGGDATDVSAASPFGHVYLEASAPFDSVPKYF